MNRRLLLIVVLVVALLSGCQENRTTSDPEPAPHKPRDYSWTPLKRLAKAHLRGLHVLDDNVIWASGTQGTVLRSVDGGEHWDVFQVPGAEELDFRDIEAFDDEHALVLSSGEGVFMYQTVDGGQSWNLIYEDSRPEIFFDGFDFADSGGLAFGDPLDGRLQLLLLGEGGEICIPLDEPQFPDIPVGEAGFAASGTSIHVEEYFAWIGTGGGSESHVIRFTSDEVIQAELVSVPMHSAEGAGVFSLCFWDDKHGAAVGGSYVDSTRSDSNGAYTTDGGLSWQPCDRTPFGYRSCVAANEDGSLLIATGRTGTDYSTDGGKTWINIGSEGYFACGIAQRTAWGVGRNGKMAVMRL